MGGDDPHFDMQDYLINWNAGPFGLVLRPDLGSDMPPCVASLLPEQSVAKLSGVRPGDMLISVNGKKTTKLGYEKVVKLLYKESLPVILHFRTPNASRPAPPAHSSVDAQLLTDDRSTRQRALSAAPQPSPAYNTNNNTRSPYPQRIGAPPPQDFDTRSITSGSSRAAPRPDAVAKERKQYTAVWEDGSLGMTFRPYSPRVNVPCVDFIGTRGRGRGMDRVCVNDVLIAINGEKTKALGVERVLRWLLVIEKPVVLRFHSSSNRVVATVSASVSSTSARALESYQPEREPRGGAAAAAPAPSRLQILYEPPAPEPRPRRFTNTAMPQDHEIHSDEPLLAYEFNGNGAAGRTDYAGSVSGRSERNAPELRRQHSAPKTPDTRRPRVFSNGLLASPARFPDDAPAATFEYLSNDRILYDGDAGGRDRRYSNAPSALGRTGATTPPPVPRTSQHKFTSPTPRRPTRDELSHDDAVLIVARSSGKPITACMFGGTPILSIREGSVQAKLLLTFAKACLARETNDEAMEPPPLRRDSSSAERSGRTHSSASVETSGDFTRDFHSSPLPQHQLSPHWQQFHSPQARAAPSPPVGRHHSQQYMGFGFTPEHESPQRTRAVSSDAATTKASPMALPPFRSPAPSRSTHVSSSAAVPPSPSPSPSPSPVVVSPPMAPVVSVAPAPVAQAPQPEPKAPVAVPEPVAPAPVPAPTPEPTAVVAPPRPALELDMRTASEHQVTLAALPLAAESSGDFLSLNDFVVQHDGHVSDRNTTSSLNSASTHVYSLHSDDDILLAIGSQADGAAPSVTSGVTNSENHDESVTNPDDDDNDDDAVEANQDDNDEPPQSEPPRAFDVLDQRVLSSTDINIARQVEDDRRARSDMISLNDLASLMSSTGGIPEAELRQFYDPVQREIDEMTHVERSSLLHPLIAEMYGFLPDLHNVVKDKPVDSLLMKKGMVDEIQDILQSLQMEAQFERHSHQGIGTLPKLGSTTSLDAGSSTSSTVPASPSSRKCCYQCGKPGELADLALEGGRRELYCQDCWEVFFYNEDRLGDSESGASGATPRSFRDSADDAYKYSFHDSSVSRSDMVGPWRYHNNGDSASSIRDSTTTIGSSITDRADEVWL